MTESGGQSLPKRCQDALNEIATGREREPDETQVTLTEEHVLHRCITSLEVDRNLDKPQPSAFERHDLSLYVEGPGLPPLDIASIIRESNGRFAGAAVIDAITILNNPMQEFKKLQLVHDPFTDSVGNKHRNHARLICTKGMRVCKELQKHVSKWSVIPTSGTN